MPTVADLILHARYIVPVEPDGIVLEDHALVITGDSITALLPSALAAAKYTAAEIIMLPDHALMPGLVNAHTHAAMSLLRGYADDLPLMTWLRERIWPAEARHVGAEFVRDGSRLAIAEMIRGGTTCFADMYFFADETARAATEAGLRAVLGLIVLDSPTAWAGGPDEYIRKGLALHDEYRSHALIRTAFAPHAPYTVGNESLAKVVTLAAELELPIHMHVHETASEISDAIQLTGQRPLQRLERLNLLSPHLMAVHMTQLDAVEIAVLARQGVNVLHCPASNLKLASGHCPVAALTGAGVNVALGTDGAASNNGLDMFSEMRTAALLAKSVAGDPSAIPADVALRMATLNGARALGLEARIGSLTPGKAADVIAVDLDVPETQPVHEVISQIVYACSRHQVSDVWVAGRPLLRARALQTLDLPETLARARLWRTRLHNAPRGETPDHNAARSQ